MNPLEPYVPVPASGEQIRLYWSDHLDALDRHLSANVWALTAMTAALIAYPIARIFIPGILHAVMPDVVRTLLHLI